MHNGRVPDGTVIRVVLADDHPVVRRGLRALLETLDGLEVVGEASNGSEAVDLVRSLEPTVVLMDLHMPIMGGVEATRAITASGSSTAVLVLSMYDDDQTVVTAVQAGARGYLLKGADQDEIARALRAVASGDVIFGPGVAGAVLGRVNTPQSPPEMFPELTTRERDILRLLTEGHRTAAIASQLYLSPKTVSNGLTSIFSKLGVTSRAEAIVTAHERGMGPNGRHR